MAKVFVRSGENYKGKRNGLKVKVKAIKVEFEIMTENGTPLVDGVKSVEMWKFRKDFEHENPAAEYLPKVKKEKELAHAHAQIDSETGPDSSGSGS